MSSRGGDASLALAWRLARRELRGGLRSRFRGFRIFMACLVLGTAAIAAVGSVSSAVEGGLAREARALLGGDIELRIHHRPATDEQIAWLEREGDLSRVVEIRAMARRVDGEDRRLVEMRAVDEPYPLVGAVELRGETDLDAAIAQRDGLFGAVADASLMNRLGLTVGDEIAIGETVMRVTAALVREPDRATRGIQLGPSIIVSHAGLAATELLQPGSLSDYKYRLVLPPGTDVEDFKTRLTERFPDAPWRIRDTSRAAPGLTRFVDRLTLFLTLVGLSALLIGGVGVGNAVHAFLAQRAATVATLKCLGAPARLVQRVYLVQVLALAAIGIAAGLMLGALAPFTAAPLLSGLLPVELAPGLYLGPLALAALFGILITLVFSLWPLALARDVPAAALFRRTIAPLRGRPDRRDLAILSGLVLALAGLTLASAREQHLAVWFVVGAAFAFAGFRLAAALAVRVARAWPRPRRPRLRLAVANLHRPGAPTASVVLSLGLGITVLVAIMMIERNLSQQIAAVVEEEAPAFYFIDIQPQQRQPFAELVASFAGAEALRSVPMLRGRIVSMAGTPVSEMTPPPEYAWITRGDRGLTWSRSPPERGSRVVAGEWWPADYDGPPLISFDAEAAVAFGLEVGDTVGFNILGRRIEARVANLRRIDWATLGMNFVVIFAPGALDGAPQISIATVRIDQAREDALEAAVSEQFPNVSAIRVREILAQVNGILASIDVAMKAIAGIAITAGVLVLSGAIAAGRRQRIYDAVVLKTLGATRADVLSAYLLEFLLLGLVTAGIAAAAGSAAAWAVTTGIMHIDWIFSPAAMVWTTAICVAATMVFGIIGAWRALGQKAAPLLRTE